jgi:hypothetical protein
LLGVNNVNANSEDYEVRSFSWTYKGEASVVADYDIAIVDLSTAGPQDNIARCALPPDDNGRTILDLLDAAHRLMIAGGDIVVIGRPDTMVWAESRGYLAGTHWTMSGWTGITYQWDEYAGDHVDGVDENSDFAPYLRQLSEYAYALRASELSALPPPDPEYLGYGIPQRRRSPALRLHTRGLAWTKHGTLIASEHRIVYETDAPQKQPGRVVVLPAARERGRDLVASILREVYGVAVASPDAPWLNDLCAPGETPIRDRIEGLRSKIETIEAEIRAADEERVANRRMLRLLSEGDSALEELVRDALRILGAHVIEPLELNKEDGWISVLLPDGIREGVLEIKSTRRATFDEGGLKQLAQWKERGRAKGKHYKGIFIGNSSYALPPAERPDPFSSSFLRSASESDVVALTTQTLLGELRRVVDGGADPLDFWRRVFATRGVYAANRS